jgi:hypothetical protein
MTINTNPANNVQTNLKGRLRNTSLPITSGLLPVYEAIVNSMQSIDEAGLTGSNGEIAIHILRDRGQGCLEFNDVPKKGPEPLSDIIGFQIEDNGNGFNDNNIQSFKYLDTDYKASLGCKGVGRLLWLKAFGNVRVESSFKVMEKVHQRSFSFTADAGITDEELKELPPGSPIQTKVSLTSFNNDYKKYTRKTAQAIAESIFHHCLWYFFRDGGAPKIRIVDNSNMIDLSDVFNERILPGSTKQEVEIKGRNFSLVHIKLKPTSSISHSAGFSANNRLVTEDKLSGKIPGLYGKLSGEDGEFIYCCYVSSLVLDESVRPERTDFDLLDRLDDLLVDSEIICKHDIRETVYNNAQNYLSAFLEQNLSRARQRIETFVSQECPRYRPVMGRIPLAEININPDINDKDLELILHEHLAKIERELISEGHDILSQTLAPLDIDYEKKLQAYLSKAEDIKKSDLANYVSHRRTIIDILEKAVERDSNGNYVREDIIHNLIIPMSKESNDLSSYASNLWLVDERLAFHHYLASNKMLQSMPITESDSNKKPDIAALNLFNEPLLISEETKPPLASIVILEIKRPMRRDSGPGEEKDPIEQATGYLTKIRSGGVQTVAGRPIPASDSIPGFCYIIADITPTFESRCRGVHDLIRTSDGLGYFGYKKNLNAYIEVISFDRLVTSAKERNRAFFDKLGLPSR